MKSEALKVLSINHINLDVPRSDHFKDMAGFTDSVHCQVNSASLLIFH